ncbi:MAG: hypothetical protein ACKOV8_08885, partial [Phycisphaerales bacterium]
EGELDGGKFRTLGEASERAGRLVAESAAAQAVIFALMQQNDPSKPPAGGLEVEAGGVEVKVGADVTVEQGLGQAGDLMRRRAE